MNTRRQTYLFGLVLAGFFAGLVSCGGPTKIEIVQKKQLKAQLVLPKESEIPELAYNTVSKKDTIVVKGSNGEEMILMKAVRDELSGDMVAHEVLNAAVITARFRNIAERHGKVDLQFQVIVPEDMMDTQWQLRFFPDMFILDDSVRLEPVIITGWDYRKAQLRGYERYDRFLSKIISDTTKFINIGQLEIFLERNIPQVFAFKTDTSFVSDEMFYSIYGVSEQEAVEHYTNHFRKRRNAKRIADREKMYRKYVKVPITSEGIRLDTVMRNINGDFVYNYTETINTRPKLRKVDIVLSGDIYQEDKRIYNIPASDPLTFYISSISSFADPTERYLTRVLERKAQANASYSIEFAKGKSDVNESLADNKGQIGFVKDNLTDLLQNEVFDLDSIVVVANASPEGSWAHNGALSKRRGDAVVKYFEDFMNAYRRQVAREGGFYVDLEGRTVSAAKDIPTIRFTSRSVPENWKLLDRLVSEDDYLSDEQKAKYLSRAGVKDMDQRERDMKQDDYYRYLVDSLYSHLRVVDFAFHLHRKGMIKDTVHTTELDENYMRGVQMLKDMDYDNAVKVLGPYQDFNAAVAYMAAERNASAMLILQNMEKTPQVNYLLAILYSRNGDAQKAVQCYMDACRADQAYVHRGNLDPEISALIKAYGLNKQVDDDIDLDY